MSHVRRPRVVKYERDGGRGSRRGVQIPLQDFGEGRVGWWEGLEECTLSEGKLQYGHPSGGTASLSSILLFFRM